VGNSGIANAELRLNNNDSENDNINTLNRLERESMDLRQSLHHLESLESLAQLESLR